MKRSTVSIGGLLAAILAILSLLSAATIFRNAAVWNDDVALWKDTSAKSSGKARVHYNLGKSLHRAGILAEAEITLLRAAELVELPSLKVDVFSSLGDIYREQGNHEQALSAYLQVLEIDEGNVAALNDLGKLLVQSGKHAEAEKLFRRAILEDPKFSGSYFNMGESLAAHGKRKDAESYFSAAKFLGYYKIPP